jgi:hypothetical protein
MAEDWEEKMLEKMAEMFKSMGMDIDIDQLRGLLDQFRGQFDALGIDAERIAKGDVNFNFDMSNLMKLFQSGKPLDELLSNLGVDVKVDAAPIVVDIEDETPTNEILNLPADDVFLSGWNMSITVDFSTRPEIEEIEIALSSGGEQIHVLSDPAKPPLAQIALPHQCEDVVDWSLNNGILDITLKLTPQGPALPEPSQSLDEDVEDDHTPASDEVSIDLADDDDDDENDGGIPIF